MGTSPLNTPPSSAALGLFAGIAALFVLLARQGGGFGIALAGKVNLQGLLCALLRGGAGGLLLGLGRRRLGLGSGRAGWRWRFCGAWQTPVDAVFRLPIIS